MNYVDKVGDIPFANAFTKFTQSFSIWGVDNTWLGRVEYNVSITHEQTDETGIFYSFASIDVDSEQVTSLTHDYMPAPYYLFIKPWIAKFWFVAFFENFFELLLNRMEDRFHRQPLSLGFLWS